MGNRHRRVTEHQIAEYRAHYSATHLGSDGSCSVASLESSLHGLDQGDDRFEGRRHRLQAKINAVKAAPVATAFSSCWSPMSLGDSRCAAMPEPMTP
jgi:hypothetical protein